MKYDPKTEALIFDIVRKEGEATRKELIEALKREGTEITEEVLLRYLFRWKARKLMTIRSRQQDGKSVEVWAADVSIPAWFISGIRGILTRPTSEGLKQELQALNDRWKTEGYAPIQKRSQWGNYKTYRLTFETVDMILGGRPTEEDRQTRFPRREGKIIVPANWLYGWFRDNQALLDMVALQYHIAFGSGEFIEQPEIIAKTLKVRMGLNTYEAIKPGAKFTVTLRFPFRGSAIKTETRLREFIVLLGEAPIRGLGANPKAFGGRVKLIKMEEIA